jgi:hypothetical protein
MELIASPRFCRSFLGLLLLLALNPRNAPARDLYVPAPASPQILAFARYVASIRERNPFTESGPVLVGIDASLPGLYKHSRLLAIGQTGELERREYDVLEVAGDATVTQEVIARYLVMQEQLENLPLSSTEITPANYKFHYLGEIGTGDSNSAYVYRIIPRKKRDGLIQGQLWIDSVTGAAVLQTGYFVKTPSSFTGRIDLVRDIQRQDGYRITHVTIQTPWAGRGELTITELPLPGTEEEHQHGLKSVPLAQIGAALVSARESGPSGSLEIR